MFSFSCSRLACVPSVSVGLSAGLKHFLLFEHVKMGGVAPNFCAAQRRKMPQTGEKKTMEMLAMQASSC